MVPETEQKSERPVVSQDPKAIMNILPNIDYKVVRDVASDGCTTSQAINVPAKLNMPVADAENPDINITDGVNPGDGNNGDTTEDSSRSSSSFEDTFSGADGALAFSDDEINSDFHGICQPSWAYPGYEEAFGTRKKKLTSHWRNFIRPLMWRCKWAELQMKKFQCQASTYSKILAKFDQGKQAQLENFSAESLCSRFLPFPRQMKRKKTMQRKKRKRVEDTTDVASYMLQHNLFAYCGTSTANAQLINGYGNLTVPAVQNGGIILADNDYLFQSGDEDTFREQILAKIDSMQSHVHDLTTRVDKVISENPGKFSSLNKLSLLAPCESGASTAQDPTSPSSDKDKVLVTSPSMATQPASEFHVEEFSMSTTPVTADQVVDPPSNTVENAYQPVVAVKSDNVEDEIPLRKRPRTEEPIVYRRGFSGKKRRMLSDTQPNISSSASSMKPLVGLTQAQNEKSGGFLASRFTSFLDNQIKRGRRTVGRRKGARSGRKLFS
ncbi:unnamed protein product [Rhodiola kirilowii]